VALNPTSVMVSKGDTLTLNATSSNNFGLPRATIRWLHNQVELDRDDPRVTISDNGVLQLTNLQTSDRGIYTVEAINSEGTATESATVLFECKLVLRKRNDIFQLCFLSCSSGSDRTNHYVGGGQYHANM